MRADLAATFCGARAAGLLLLLAACATVAPAPEEPIPAFTLTGRILARGSDAAFASGLRWEASARRDEIWLTTPLGQALAHVERDADGAVLTTAEQRQYRARSIESLTRSALGWELPVTGLRYWVLGRPAPMPVSGEVVRDAHGRPVALDQDGWRVAFDYVGDTARPQRLQGAREGAEFRLAIDTLDLAQDAP